MKKVLVSVSVVAISLMAADYSQMSMEELNSLRGTIAVEERDAFKAEMQSRMQAMTPEERAQYQAERRKGMGMGQKQGNGSGKGKMHRGGNQQGQGIQQRLRDGSGAGSMKMKQNGAGGQGKGRR